MPRHVRSTMKPTPTVASRVIPSSEVLKSEYSSKYLESLGANPTSANITTLLKELPIEKALLVPVWTKGEMAIFPGMANARKADQEHLIKSMNMPSKGQLEEEKAAGDEAAAEAEAEEAERTEKGGAWDEKQPPQKSMKRALKDAGPTKATVAQIPKTETPSGRKISWSTVHTLNLNEPLLDRGTYEPLLRPTEIQTDGFRALLVPPSYRKSDVDGSIMLFCRNLGSYAPRIKDDKTGDTFNEVKKVVSCKLAVTLYQKLLEFAYWNVIHPWANDLYTRAQHYANLTGVTTGVDFLDVDDEASIGQASASENASGNRFGEGGQSLAGTEASMGAKEKERLFLELQEALMVMKRKIGTTKKAVVTSLQALVCLSHYLVDDMLTILYPWFDAWEVVTVRQRQKKQRKRLGLQKTDTLPPFTEKELALHAQEDVDRARKCVLAKKVRRLVHQAVAELIDPSRIFTQHLLVSNYVGTDQVGLTKNTSRARFYNTSVAVRSVLGDATSDASRRFMKYAEPVHLPTPGVAKPGVSLPTETFSPSASGEVHQGNAYAGEEGLDPSLEGEPSLGRSLTWSEQRSRLRVVEKREAERVKQEEKEREENNRVLQLSLVTPLSMTTRDSRRQQTHRSLKHVKPPRKELTVSEKLGLADTSGPEKPTKPATILEEQEQMQQARYSSRERVGHRLASTLATDIHRGHPECQDDHHLLKRKVDLNLRSVDSSHHDPYSLTGSRQGGFDFQNIFAGSVTGGGRGGTGTLSRSQPSSPTYSSPRHRQPPIEVMWTATATGTRDAFRATRADFNVTASHPGHTGDDGTVGSMSAASAGSLVANRRADLKVSISTQARLMEVVVHEKAAAYSDIEIARKRILLNE